MQDAAQFTRPSVCSHSTIRSRSDSSSLIVSAP